jgi:DNA-binding response OmpR family regulator
MSEKAEKIVLGVVYDPIIGKMINRILKKEFTVEIAGTLEEAREKINELQLNAVITDWTRVNGPEVIKSAKEKGVRKIIVINGGLINKRELEELKKTDVDILPKPFELKELIAAVRGEISEMETENREN